MRANPLDGLVLLSGCDKTTPGLLMAAASVDLPAVMVTGGPMLTGKFHGQDLGSGTHVWKLESDLKAGRITADQLREAEGCMSRSNGHCMTMGTASTMACMAEALGMQLPGSASWPAVDSRRYEVAQEAGARAVSMVHEDLRPQKIMTRAAFENAIRVNAAIGGSTNAVIHLTAIAGRLGVPLSLDDFDSLARPVPTLVDLLPSGHHLMEDFCYAGGLPVVMLELAEAGLLNTGQLTVTGKSVGENVAGAQCWDRDVIRTVNEPFQPPGTGTAVLRGNLCPGGAVIKQSAASPELMKHRGRALVFDSPEAYNAVCDGGRLRRRAERHHRGPLFRPEGLSRDARGFQCAPAGKTGEARHYGYGPHLRRPDERHGFRDRCAARLPGGRRRRAARSGEDGRHHRAGRARPQPAPRRLGRGAGAAAGGLEPSRPKGAVRLYVAVHRARLAGRRRRRFRLPARFPGSRRPPRQPLTPTRREQRSPPAPR